MASRLSRRVRAQLRLAVLGDCACDDTRAGLEQAARASGLTGAEIDAARDFRSFEVRTAALLAYACALRSGDDDERTAAVARAQRVGIAPPELQAIDREVAGLLRKGNADVRATD